MSNSSTGFTTTTRTNPDHLFFASSAEQLCYVHCGFCDTVLAVSVPCSSLLKTVTVRCGHCSNLLSVNMRGLLLPAATTTSAATVANHHQLHLGPTPFFTSPHNLLDEIRNSAPNLLMNHQAITNHEQLLLPPPTVADHLNINLKPPVVNRPPEKRQRVPSAYNRFIKDEIQRIKAGNPDISHREAFSAAAKNWAHFPHIHFGLMRPDHHQPVKKANVRHQQDGEDHVGMKDGFLAAQANVGVAP